MKNGKSSGIDEIPAELYKEGGEWIIDELVKLFNDIYKTKSVPKEWGRAVICPIF